MIGMPRCDQRPNGGFRLPIGARDRTLVVLVVNGEAGTEMGGNSLPGMVGAEQRGLKAGGELGLGRHGHDPGQKGRWRT